jgi:perosamine synthetase
MSLERTIARATVFRDGTIRQAMQAIDRGAIGVALVIDEQTSQFVGLVTDGDLRRSLLSGRGLEAPIVEVLRPDPKVATSGMSQEEIAALLSEVVRVVPILNENRQVLDQAVFDSRSHLPVAQPFIADKELSYVMECVLTGWISSAGKFVTRFEEIFAEFCGARYGIATSSGTTALHLALLTAGVGEGDEVIVPTLTFIATANAVKYTGARPVFVDSEDSTWNVDAGRIEEAVTPRTKAIIPVHLFGHPADMDPILEIASRHGLTVIEDAAEAHGACYKEKRVGNLGDLGIFSFYGNKIVTTGEGGILVTDRPDLAEKARLLRDHGMSREKRYWHTVLGYNYRLTNLQAAVGVGQMEKIEQILQKKRWIAHRYDEILKDQAGLSPPPEASWAHNVYWLYAVLMEPEFFGCSRDELIARLLERGIEARPFFPPVHTQPVYSTGQSLPVAERLAAIGLCLPSAPQLHSTDIQRVAAALQELAR